jgi:hypothetical protein
LCVPGRTFTSATDVANAVAQLVEALRDKPVADSIRGDVIEIFH